MIPKFNLKLKTLLALLVISMIVCGCTPKKEGFTLKGMKGYGWTPEICLEEIPTLKEYGLNFFAPCYSSFFAEHDIEKFEELDGYNRWWEPLTDDLKTRWAKVVKECEQNDIIFCFGMNPMLFSPRPLDTANEVKGLDVFRIKKDDSDIYKYVAGRYDTPEAAKAKVSEVRKKFP